MLYTLKYHQVEVSKMPSIFKAFASITVWVLFIFGCLALIGGFVRIFATRVPGELALVSAYFGYGILSLISSVVAAKLRQTMG